MKTKEQMEMERNKGMERRTKMLMGMKTKTPVRKRVLSLLAALLFFTGVMGMAMPARADVTLQVVKCRESVTLRATPSTSARALCQIPLGAYVQAAERPPEGKFCSVTYNGMSGYVLADFLATPGGGQPQQQAQQPPQGGGNGGTVTLRVVKCRQSITLRATPSTSARALCQIPLGALVQAANQPPVGEFCAVTYNGMSGYALAEYLTQA